VDQKNVNFLAQLHYRAYLGSLAPAPPLEVKVSVLIVNVANFYAKIRKLLKMYT